MIIQILNVENGKGGNGKRNWNTAEVTYKDENGKPSSKKLVSFNFPEVFEVLSKAGSGMRFDIRAEKNDKGYWDWVGATPVEGSASSSQPQPAEEGRPGKTQTYTDPRETKEERAQRQTFIIRQSCLGNAVTFLQGRTEDQQSVFMLAKAFEDWVTRAEGSILDLADNPV